MSPALKEHSGLFPGCSLRLYEPPTLLWVLHRDDLHIEISSPHRSLPTAGESTYWFQVSSHRPQSYVLNKWIVGPTEVIGLTILLTPTLQNRKERKKGSLQKENFVAAPFLSDSDSMRSLT